MLLASYFDVILHNVLEILLFSLEQAPNLVTSLLQLALSGPQQEQYR
jgi:hypothetical protein